MDYILCDELLIEIFQRLPKQSLTTVNLVSKRWLRLSRRSTTTLSLHLQNQNQTHIFLSLLNQYPFLSCLSISLTTSFNDHLIFSSVATSCRNLRCLRFLTGPVSVSCLKSFSFLLSQLTSLTVPVSRPVNLSWVGCFPCLNDLSLIITTTISDSNETDRFVFNDLNFELGLESVTISGLSSVDLGVSWLWRNCVKLRKLRLRNCDGVGDGGSFSKCLSGLTEVELRSCRSIADLILIKLAEYSFGLNSLLVYDGGSKHGLLHFINNCKSKLLHKFDLRLPLDLENDHLSSIGFNFNTISCLKLQSCCLVTGDGLKAFSLSVSESLQELALINCDVVDGVSGLLTTLGQNLKNLRRLDLSYNEMLVDKELISMLVSCTCMVDLKLRGCKGLTNMTLMSLGTICVNLESIDIVHCCGIGAQGVEYLILKSKRLNNVRVEQNKLSNDARMWASKRFIQLAV